MQGAILTQSQASQLLGQFYTTNSYFNPTLDVDANIYISIEEINGCTAPSFQWVKSLTIVTITPFQWQTN
jgi:hypothetical protein